jgi:hypothetical protein
VAEPRVVALLLAELRVRRQAAVQQGQLAHRLDAADRRAPPRLGRARQLGAPQQLRAVAIAQPALAGAARC